MCAFIMDIKIINKRWNNGVYKFGQARFVQTLNFSFCRQALIKVDREDRLFKVGFNDIPKGLFILSKPRDSCFDFLILFKDFKIITIGN
jgi:hypothetical protein